MTEPQKSEASELRQQITKCFRDIYMQTGGETELFDTDETIDALELLIRQREAEAYKKGREHTLREIELDIKNMRLGE